MTTTIATSTDPTTAVITGVGLQTTGDLMIVDLATGTLARADPTTTALDPGAS